MSSRIFLWASCTLFWRKVVRSTSASHFSPTVFIYFPNCGIRRKTWSYFHLRNLCPAVFQAPTWNDRRHWGLVGRDCIHWSSQSHWLPLLESFWIKTKLLGSRSMEVLFSVPMPQPDIFALSPQTCQVPSSQSFHCTMQTLSCLFYLGQHKSTSVEYPCRIGGYGQVALPLNLCSSSLVRYGTVKIKYLPGAHPRPRPLTHSTCELVSCNSLPQDTAEPQATASAVGTG